MEAKFEWRPVSYGEVLVSGERMFGYVTDVDKNAKTLPGGLFKTRLLVPAVKFDPEFDCRGPKVHRSAAIGMDGANSVAVEAGVEAAKKAVESSLKMTVMEMTERMARFQEMLLEALGGLDQEKPFNMN